MSQVSGDFQNQTVRVKSRRFPEEVQDAISALRAGKSEAFSFFADQHMFIEKVVILSEKKDAGVSDAEYLRWETEYQKIKST